MIKSTRAIRSCSAFLILTVTCVLYLTQDYQNLKPRHRFTRSTSVKGGNASEIATGDYKMMKVWIASSVSVFIISAVGLLGVAVVPLVQKVFYNKVIQYLVALAVGTLTGDAFLHLMPHAMLGGHKDSNEEFIAVMKGLVALGGIYFFFFAEKCISMIADNRAEKKAEEEERQRQIKDPRRSEIRRMSVMQMSIGSAGNRRISHLTNNRDSAMFRRLSKLSSNELEDNNVIPTVLGRRAMKSIDNLIRFADLEAGEDFMKSLQSGTTVTYQPPLTGDENNKMGGEIQLSVTSSTNKPHTSKDKQEVAIDGRGRPSIEGVTIETRVRNGGHGHGHSHEIPGSIATVAWMVIFGDGLHNFTDGLAIGAAFADSIAGGISTSVAVFCHELPHELGDFAVLLKTGMKVKQALFYNIVSSILCFLGMFMGIGLHNVENASYWIFAITAGIFVYIALVDMLPELNSDEIRPGESRIIHLLIQNLGLITGVGVMLLIAIFEDKIKDMLN